MDAIVVSQPGPPEVLELKHMPCPQPGLGWVLVRVQAAGLNRPEIFTRQGHTPSVAFPRVLGMECVGLVHEAPDGGFRYGQKVAALMGGMGHAFNGSYAQFACVRESSVLPIDSELDWVTLAAIPETFLTAWGALFEALELAAEHTLLIRGGSSAVGMAAIVLAKDLGAAVLATTRNPDKRERLLGIGADDVVIDDGEIYQRVRDVAPGGVDRVLELVGPLTIADSIRAATHDAVICSAGILGNRWNRPDFRKVAHLMEYMTLTDYSSESLEHDAAADTLQRIVESIEAGRYGVNVDRVFSFDQIVDAHRTMEASQACGKVVLQVA